MYGFKKLIPLGLAVSAVLSAQETANGFVPGPAVPASAFTLTLDGDVVNDINTAELANDIQVNPFAYVNQIIIGRGTSSVTAALVNGNTVVTYSGSNPVLSTYTYSYGNEPHFGLNSPGVQFSVVSENWLGGSSLPSVSLAGPPATGSDVKYGVVFAGSSAGGQTTGQWLEIPFSSAGIPLFTFVNEESTPISLSDVGFLASPTMIPLDTLNFADMPPPGVKGSRFFPIVQDDGRTLAPGASLNLTPEPSTLLLLCVGVLGLVGYAVRQARFRRRQVS